MGLFFIMEKNYLRKVPKKTTENVIALGGSIKFKDFVNLKLMLLYQKNISL